MKAALLSFHNAYNYGAALQAYALQCAVRKLGAECEYKVAAEILNSVSDKFGDFLCVTGNHDIRKRNYTRQRGVFRKFPDFLCQFFQTFYVNSHVI